MLVESAVEGLAPKINRDSPYLKPGVLVTIVSVKWEYQTEVLIVQVKRVQSLSALEKGAQWEPQDVYKYGEDVQILATKLVATQDALEAMCMEKESQKLFYEERLQCVSLPLCLTRSV